MTPSPHNDPTHSAGTAQSAHVSQSAHPTPGDDTATQAYIDSLPAPAAMIEAHSLGMKGGSTVFADVTVAVPRGDVLLIEGKAGSGKTSLMLALTGRMKITAGSAAVDGKDVKKQARRVRAITALGPVKGITDLDDNLTVEQHVAERIIMFNPWYKPLASRKRVDDTVDRIRMLSQRVTLMIQGDAVGSGPSPHAGPEAEPTEADPAGAPDSSGASAASPAGSGPEQTDGQFHATTYISDLNDLDRFLLGLALALIGGPLVVACDDLDLLRRSEDRVKAWLYVLAGPQLLSGELDDQLTMVVTCEDSTDINEALRISQNLGITTPAVHRIELPTHSPGGAVPAHHHGTKEV